MDKKTLKSSIGTGKTVITAGEQCKYGNPFAVQNYSWKSIDELITQLCVSMLDCVEIFYVFNITKNEFVISPIRIRSRGICSVEKSKLPENYSLSEYIRCVADNVGIADSVSFIEFFDIKKLTDSFKNGKTLLSRCFKMKDRLGNEATIEQRVLLFMDDAVGDLMGITYVLNIDEINKNSNKCRIGNYIDHITDGYNRKGFIRAVEKFSDGGADLKEYAMLYINIKGFKAINEVFGSDGGDELLKAIYERFSKSELNPVISGRIEADHFAFLVKQEDMNTDILTELTRFVWKNKEQEIFIHCVGGIYNITHDGVSVYRMLDGAKLAKEHIINQYYKPYAIFDRTMIADYVEHIKVLSKFSQGIKNNEFEVYYQPIMDVKAGKIVSAEALVRWNTSDGKQIKPNRFIPELEKSGHITKLDEYVTRVVTEFLHKRFDVGLSFVPVSINLSRADFHAEEKVNMMLEGLENSKLPAGALRFEITETTYAVMESEEKEIIERLKKCGCQIYLDDFGSGYSYLSMLQKYNFDFLKIDISFTRQLTTNPIIRTILRTIISLCHELNIKVVAEGVETEGELNILKELDCDGAQGYYFSKPMCGKDFNEYLNREIK